MTKKYCTLMNLILVAALVLAFAGCSTVDSLPADTPYVPLPGNIQEDGSAASQDSSAPLKLNVLGYEATIVRKDNNAVLISYPSVVYPQDIISFATYMSDKYPGFFAGSTFILLGDNTAYLELDYPFTDEEVRQYLPTISSEIEAFVPVYFASLEQVGAPVRLSEKAIAEAAAQKAEAQKAESATDIPVVVSTPTAATEIPSVVPERESVPAAQSVTVPEPEVQAAPVSEKAVEITAVANVQAVDSRRSAGPIILVAVIVILAASCVCIYLITKKKKN